jgi:hypothetical protein
MPRPDRPHPDAPGYEVARLWMTAQHEDGNGGRRAPCHRNSGRGLSGPLVLAVRRAAALASGDISDPAGRARGCDRSWGELGNPIAPDISQWAGTLENKLKGGCCASADGWKPEAVEYDIAADHYRVRIEGEWHDGPADACSTGLTRSDLHWSGTIGPTSTAKGRWSTFAAFCLEPAARGVAP